MGLLLLFTTEQEQSSKLLSTGRNTELPVLYFSICMKCMPKSLPWIFHFQMAYSSLWIGTWNGSYVHVTPCFPLPEKATWEIQTSVDKRNAVICQGGLSSVRTGVQSVNICCADVKNSKSLPKCLWYLRWATSSQSSYRWASKLQSPTQLTAATPQSPMHLYKVHGGSIFAFRLRLTRFVQISNLKSFNHSADYVQSQFGNIRVRFQNQWAIISFTLSTQVNKGHLPIACRITYQGSLGYKRVSEPWQKSDAQYIQETIG